MLEFYESVRDRFIRYVKVDSQSQAGSSTAPSTMKQMNMGRLLAEELKSIGVQNVELTEHCLVYGTIPSTLPDGKGISIGFSAHMDTTPDSEGANVKPWVLKNYQGGKVVLNKELGISMDENTHPTLKKYIGQDLVFTDGTTLLGGDDKSAIAALVTMAEYFCKHPEVPHGPIQICFGPDEEVGRGTENLSIERFGADLAYTVDGDGLGGIFDETFNAAPPENGRRGKNKEIGENYGRVFGVYIHRPLASPVHMDQPAAAGDAAEKIPFQAGE